MSSGVTRAPKPKPRSWKLRAIIGFVLWLPIEMAHWISLLVTSSHEAHAMWIYIEVAASTVAMVYLGWAFYRGAWRGLRMRTTNMDTLIALGTTVAYGYSVIALIGAVVGWWNPVRDLYFMEAVGILALISVGHWLEARARDMTGAAIHELMRLSPSTALKMTNDNPADAKRVPVASIKAGDRVLVRPGDLVPVDGKVIDGISHVDEAMISGEPLAREPNGGPRRRRGNREPGWLPSGSCCEGRFSNGAGANRRHGRERADTESAGTEAH